jgi:beta-glucosidase
MRWYFAVLFIFCLSLIAGCQSGEKTQSQSASETLPYLDVSLDFETRAADLVERMTLEEKISQLGNSAPAIPRLDVPEYDWWNECLHGVAVSGIATVFPQAIGMAATFDPDMMYNTATIISDEARAKHHEFVRNGDRGRFKGLTFWSPNINIFRDPRWGRGQETYGEDPYLTGQIGIQFVRGLQGDDPKYLKLVSTPKHYAVHSGPEPDRHTFNAVPNVRDLWETYLPAFEDLIVEGKAYSIMGAYNRVDSESASGSWMLLRDILREQWGFEGYVVSDCGAIRDIFANHKIVNDAVEAAAVGVRRGCDLNCGDVYQQQLLEAVQKGMIGEGEIDLAVYRLMLARMKLGMFDPPEMVAYAQIPFSVNDSKEHDEAALAMAQKSMTLLKNDGILPLDKSKIKKIAVVGPNADSIVALRGNYNGTPSHPVTILDGIGAAVGDDVEVLYSLGCPLAEGAGQAAFPVIDSRYLFTTDESGQEVHGLKGEYFNNIDLQGEPALIRIDPVIKMDWALTSPTTTDIAQGRLSEDKKINEDDFSARWTGQLLAPVSGVYKLGIVSDDGCRLYVNGARIIDDWTNHAMSTFTADISLEKGQRYDIKIEFFEGIQDAGIHFVWMPPESDAFPRRMDDKALENISKADVAIFVGGLSAEVEGEEMRLEAEGFAGGDRTKIELPPIQLETLKKLQQTGTPVVFVLLSGSAVALEGVENDIPAILAAWYPGQRGGDAVADVLFGDYNPAGRLPVTFYTSTDELADFRDYNMTAGKGRTYRYYKGKPLYSFGHGLSYTTFSYSNLKVNKEKVDKNGQLKVKVDVTNTGSRDGEEVVQLYVRDVESSRPMPVKQLRGFERISLEQGQTKTVTFTLTPIEDMHYYNAQQECYTVEPGEFEIQVGASSSDIRVTKTISVR